MAFLSPRFTVIRKDCKPLLPPLKGLNLNFHFPTILIRWSSDRSLGNSIKRDALPTVPPPTQPSSLVCLIFRTH